MRQYPNPGTRVQSTETGAYGTYVGKGMTYWDACVQNGVEWKARTCDWPKSKLQLADENDPRRKESA